MKHIPFYSLISFCVSISMPIIGMDVDPIAPTVEKTQEQSAVDLKLPKTCNRLILLLDPNKTEKLIYSLDPLAKILANALIEKAAPIIATTNIIQNLCSWKINPALQVDPFPVQAFATLDFTDRDWYWYIHKQAGLILLIPKNYCAKPFLQQIDAVAEIHAEQCAKLCDFDTQTLEIIKNVSPNGIIEYINHHKPDYTDIVTHIDSMFLKPHFITSHSPSWNIFLAGHSSTIGRQPFISFTSLPQKEELKKLEAQLARELLNHDELEETKLERSELLFDTSPEIAALKRSSRKIHNIKNKIKKIKSSFHKTDFRSSSRKEKNILNNMLSLRPKIAGLHYDEFLKLLSFFEHGITTSYLHYTTCFSGGFNQALVNEMLSQLNVNFIVSSQGINEQTTHAFDIRYVKDRMSFTHFFTLLKDFFCNPTTFVISKSMHKALQKDPISAILSTIIEPSHKTYPFVRIPAIGVFNAFTVDKKVKIITNTLARAHEHEGKVFNFTHPEIESIIVYPVYIHSPLAIKENTFIISPAPQK